MDEYELQTIYNYLATGHCAYKSKSTREKKMRCDHQLTITGTCRYIECPLVQPNHISFQRGEEIIYLLQKVPDKPPAESIKVTPLPENYDEGLKVVEPLMADFPDNLKEDIVRKLEILYDRANAIRIAKSLDTEGEEAAEEEMG